MNSLALAVQGVELRVELDARQAENRVNAKATEGANDGFAACHAPGQAEFPANTASYLSRADIAT